MGNGRLIRHRIAPPLLLALCAAVCCASEENSSPRGTLPPKEHTWSAFRCKASARPERRSIAPGQPLIVRCEIGCTGGAGEIYNGFLAPNKKCAAKIVITTADGITQRELPVQDQRADKERDSATTWLFLREGEGAGRRVHVAINGNGDERHNLKLAPGEYYVQAIYSYWLIPVRPRTLDALSPEPTEADEPHPFPNWDKAKMDRPMAVSEPAKFVVLAEGSSEQPLTSSDPITIELGPSPLRAQFGEKTAVRITMLNHTSKAVEVFDPLLNGLLWPRRAVTLDVTSKDGTFHGNLLFRDFGSSMHEGTKDWVTLPPGGLVSTTFAFKAGILLAGQKELELGKYQLQLKARGHLVSGRPDLLIPGEAPDDTRTSWREWRRTFPGPELCESEPIEFEIIPRVSE
jgi:hypothetical protein